MKFSVIVPVYNRPDEIEELLESLCLQTDRNFELIVVEDGSEIDCKKQVEKFSDKLEIKYFYKINEKPAIARNYGVERASGDYVVFVDSDCILPPDYISKLNSYIEKEDVDVFGGPDAASKNFSNLQKAINYSMTAFFTTGSIRGGEKVDKFYPRSFNMGVKRTVFNEIKGFPVTQMHPGEDMVFAIELINKGYKTRLFKKAFVYHKRRNTIKSFFQQVFAFGKTRFIISKHYPATFKIFYLAPTAFVLGCVLIVLLSAFWWFAITPLLFYILLLFTDSLIKNKSLKVATLSIVTSFFQLFGYGLGFVQIPLRGDKLGLLKTKFY